MIKLDLREKIKNLFYPPSQKTTGLPVVEHENNASADVANRQSLSKFADNPPKPKAKALWRRRIDKGITPACRNASLRRAGTGLPRGLHFLIRVILSLGLIVFLFKKFDFSKTWAVIKTADLNYFIFVLLLIFIVLFLLLLRWYMLIRISGLNIPFNKVAVSFSIGLFFNLFLPSSAGGDVARSIDLFGHSKEKAKIVASVILDRLSGFVSIAIISLFSLFIGNRLINDNSIFLIIGILLFCFLATILILFSSNIFLRLCKLFAKFQTLKLKLESLHNSMLIYRAKYPLIFINVFISFIAQFLSFIAFYLIAKSIHTQINFIYFLIFVPIIFAISMLPISIGGLGVRDSSFVYLFSKVGVSPNISLSISLINFFIVLITGILGGVIYVIAFYSRRLQYHKTN